MNARTQITLDPETQRRAQEKAASLGISFAEYVRRLIAKDIGARRRKADISEIFGLGDSGGTDIARDKDRLIGEAIARERNLDRARRAIPKKKRE
jgi:hypothetical protein